ncbi:MAG: hypothetical protein JNK14_09220 [Chitinophagaceae bacterium]|nr:hypothetical protein [Chitinophagaceae bacterium]
MKVFFFSLLLCLFVSAAAFGQGKDNKIAKPDSAKKVEIVEAACGLCQFGMSGKGCELAVRINGKSYYVDGTSIDEHGDAHAKDGFCNAIRKAEVQGEIANDRFKATYFTLVKNLRKKDQKKNPTQ